MTTSDKSQIRDAVVRFFDDVRGGGLSSALSTADAARQALALELSSQLTQPLNEYLASQSQKSYQDKAGLARALTQQLDKLDLAICHPHDKAPCRIAVVSTPDGHGAYTFVRSDPECEEVDIRTFDSIPPLEFRPANRPEKQVWHHKFRQSSPTIR